MISEERIREVFTELVDIDSESFSEKEIGENCHPTAPKTGPGRDHGRQYGSCIPSGPSR